jgi:hypothetical protein
MNKAIGVQLIIYSLLLAGLAFMTHARTPELARPTMFAGLLGGGLCLVWGLRAVAGNRGKALPLLTLIPVGFVLLSQTVIAWTGGAARDARPAAMMITVLLALTIAMLMRIAYAGVVFEGQQPSAKSEPDRAPAPQEKQVRPSNLRAR